MKCHIYRRRKYNVNFQAYISRISSFHTFPMPEASISMLGRKIFSPDLRGVSKVSKLIPLVSVLLYLCKSIQISEYLQQDVYRSALLTISLASLQGSSLPPSQLSHHASLDKEQIVVHLVMKRDKNNQQLLLSS